LDFIDAMNAKAQKLGLKNTHFDNETGLPDPKHYSSAYDLAVISRELLKHHEILKFTSIWMDNLRGGRFILRNTNELIKVYPGADGLKTGHTDEAKFCLSATARRNKFRLLSVILGAASNRERIFQTRRLLDYGFRSFQWRLVQSTKKDAGTISLKDTLPRKIPVRVGTDFGVLVERETKTILKTNLVSLKEITLPLKPGAMVGNLVLTVNGKKAGQTPVYTTVAVKRANFIVRGWRALWELLGNLFSGKLFRKKA
jgi:D-alanyl-D-alanine carboxypeptidase (penicillin-binding protein 5/6)